MVSPVYKDKALEELTRDELIECARYWHNVHVETTLRMADNLRRMSKLEEALSEEEIAKLDRWLKHHPRDVLKGDSTELYKNWRL
jgi:hypothetical protein